MKKTILAIFLASLALAVNAQEQKADSITPRPTKWYDNFKLSGYGMLQYQFEDKEGGSHNEFNLRLMRLILDGKIKDFNWRVQLQGTSNKGPGESTVSLMDLYVEWAKYKEARIKVGEFKRAFTFENHTHPITQGWYSYANVINALSGLGDRTGEPSSGGRDIGLMVQGDLFPMDDGRRFLHYQIGVYNGEGINWKDQDKRKDIIGGLWVVPFDGFRIGGFGWTGSRGGMTDPVSGEKVSIKKNRFAVSAEYDKNEYTFRAEYLYSYGWGAERVGSKTIDYSKGKKADGWYVFGIVPVIKSKLHAKARYQTYRDNRKWNRSKTMYEVGLNYYFHKNLQLNVEYARVNDRTIADPDKHNYNFFDAELDFRF